MDQKDINIEIELLKTKIMSDLQKANLPIAVIYYLIKDINNIISENYLEYLRKYNYKNGANEDQEEE